MAFALAGCKKTSTSTTDPATTPVTTDLADGLPKDVQSINGYFYANYTASNFGSTSINGYCVLHDEPTDLMPNFSHYTDQQIFSGTSNLGNIQVGNISFNNITLFESNNGVNSVFYTFNNSGGSSGSNSGPSTAIWKTDGNGSFKALNLNIPRGFPRINASSGTPGTLVTFTMSATNASSTLDLSSVVSNYDSLVVMLGSQFSSYSIKKFLKSPANSVTFTKAEILSNGSSASQIQIMAYNYSNKMVQNRLYVFELSSKLSTYVYIQ